MNATRQTAFSLIATFLPEFFIMTIIIDWQVLRLTILEWSVTLHTILILFVVSKNKTLCVVTSESK